MNRTSKTTLDFSFGFNNPQFSDRLLEIQISAGDDNHAEREKKCSKGGAGVSGTVTGSQCKKRKKNEEEAEGPAGDGNESLHVSSLLLAAHSTVFKAMFTNGMLESEAKQPVILHVATQAEQTAAIELIKFLYSNTLPDSVTSFEALLELLLCADKYSIAPCVAACAVRLAKWDATSAQRAALLSLPATAAEVKEVKQLIEKVEVKLAEEFEHLDDTWQHPACPFLKLQYLEVEAVLRSGHLRTVSEETLFSATLKWCRQYPTEQRVGYVAQLAQHIRFPHMSCEFIIDSVMKEDEMKSLECTRLVAEAGLFRGSSLQRQQQIAASAKGNSRYQSRKTGCRFEIEATPDQCKALQVGQSIEGAPQMCGKHLFHLKLLQSPGDRALEACVCLVGKTDNFSAVLKVEVFSRGTQAWDTRCSKQQVAFSNFGAWGNRVIVKTSKEHAEWRTGTLRVRATLVPRQ